MVVHQNVSLLPYNTFKIDVNAQYLMRVENLDDLEDVFLSSQYKGLPKLVIGSGSNILFTGNQRKAIIQMGIEGIDQIKEDSNHIWVKVGAGVLWHQFVMWCVQNNFGGVENLSLIPGTVGAAPIQNIGAYGVELKDVFESLQAFDIKSGELVTFSKTECRFDYRNSVFKSELKDQYIIISVTFKLDKKPKLSIEYGAIKETLIEMGAAELNIRVVSKAIIHIRQTKLPDPVLIGNAGSFFKNPIIEKQHYEALQEVFPTIPHFPISDEEVKIPAGWLIENAGWKGKKVGAVGVHDKQALVLVNYGGGKGAEVLKLSKMIQNAIQKNYGISLQSEVNII
jgi:UDP-N-acetylmuramate dehydrogenase